MTKPVETIEEKDLKSVLKSYKNGCVACELLSDLYSAGCEKSKRYERDAAIVAVRQAWVDALRRHTGIDALAYVLFHEELVRASLCNDGLPVSRSPESGLSIFRLSPADPRGMN
jgi:hypothetical protein